MIEVGGHDFFPSVNLNLDPHLLDEIDFCSFIKNSTDICMAEVHWSVNFNWKLMETKQ